MKNVSELTLSLDLSKYRRFVYAAETLPDVFHTFGKPVPKVSGPHFITYANTTQPKDSLGFSRFILEHAELRDLADQFYQDTKQIWAVLPFVPGKVTLVKSVGDVELHRDDIGRMCCLNFGLLRSSFSTTELASNNSLESPGDFEGFTVKQGSGYLVNVSWPHKVTCRLRASRWLLNYSFELSYTEVQRRLIGLGLCKD